MTSRCVSTVAHLWLKICVANRGYPADLDTVGLVVVIVVAAVAAVVEPAMKRMMVSWINKA